ncbi:type IV toxin-antitoxin system AbiEi family antitoxin [Salinibacter ruber]|jgi:hypothetical protein|uniref:HTH marR-type domain-containing protein n=1 Tax=Salinibacter ruber TaxID=146919 RepID=A0A9X3A006_9BACT|nr:type IV toxin-antitoxin system AbiEi family antitoxin [Salinibacter ruber]MCS3612973.1 hypothetical protein [Salinibacter ruber]MCS3616443.1 hypothetical protein [Salinibacter ruber]MCS3675704.1 hypothetical protein [Salinibacter ruber]MCS4037723.1 hypothetical protein [Salinibacter ruber]
MKAPDEAEAESRVERLLQEWIEGRARVERLEEENSQMGEPRIWDFTVQLRDETLIGEYRRSGDISTISRAIEQLKEGLRQSSGDDRPLLIVPFMGEKGARRCQEEKISWIDLSGNAHLHTKSFLIHVEGKPNQFKQKGRPANPFAPKSSRISRFLLARPNQRFRQKEIANQAGVGRGWTSKVIRRLEEKKLVNRDEDGRVKVPDPSLLLDAWHEKYDFSKHRIMKGTVASKESVGLMKRLARAFESAGVEYAATGLAAAWLLTRFARFRIATFYLSRQLEEGLKRKIGLREDPKGANVWLVVPNDEGVFYENSTREDVRHVHPVQVYLDLKGHPERSEEAASSIKKEYLNWRKSDG